MTTRQPLFGISVVPVAAAHRDIVAQVLAAERGGLDLVGIQDHPYQRRFLDTFALIADLLARTSRIRLFPDVANLPLRGPTMIAGIDAFIFWPTAGELAQVETFAAVVAPTVREALAAG